MSELKFTLEYVRTAVEEMGLDEAIHKIPAKDIDDLPLSVLWELAQASRRKIEEMLRSRGG